MYHEGKEVQELFLKMTAQNEIITSIHIMGRLKLHDWTLHDWTLTDWTMTDECVGS